MQGPDPRLIEALLSFEKAAAALDPAGAYVPPAPPTPVTRPYGSGAASVSTVTPAPALTREARAMPVLLLVGGAALAWWAFNHD